MCLLIPFLGISSVQSQILPEEIQFIRQGAQRLIFDEEQSITMAKLEPKILLVSQQCPPYGETQPEIQINQDKLNIKSEGNVQTNIWFGGFNAFISYTIDLESSSGNGGFGFEFSDADGKEGLLSKYYLKTIY